MALFCLTLRSRLSHPLGPGFPGLLRSPGTGRGGAFHPVPRRGGNLRLDEEGLRRLPRLRLRMVLLDQQPLLFPQPPDFHGEQRGLHRRDRLGLPGREHVFRDDGFADLLLVRHPSEHPRAEIRKVAAESGSHRDLGSGPGPYPDGRLRLLHVRIGQPDHRARAPSRPLRLHSDLLGADVLRVRGAGAGLDHGRRDPQSPEEHPAGSALRGPRDRGDLHLGNPVHLRGASFTGHQHRERRDAGDCGGDLPGGHGVDPLGHGVSSHAERPRGSERLGGRVGPDSLRGGARPVPPGGVRPDPS